MIRLTKNLVKRWLEKLLHVHDTPRRTAAAFAVGVFCGFSPFMGLHTVMGLGLAFLFNLNRVAALLGVYSNLPWVIVPYYVFTTMAIGAPLTGYQMPPGFEAQIGALFEFSVLQADFWRQMAIILRPWLLPFLLGSTLGAIVLAGVAYPIALGFVASRRRIHDMLHSHPPASRKR
jgi:uncharacterized protein (DUF2062 family)